MAKGPVLSSALGLTWGKPACRARTLYLAKQGSQVREHSWGGGGDRVPSFPHPPLFKGAPRPREGQAAHCAPASPGTG